MLPTTSPAAHPAVAPGGPPRMKPMPAPTNGAVNPTKSRMP
ncbi:MAG: hypothetical protein WBG70_16115 [Spirulinaceae cyanobacterium]